MTGEAETPSRRSSPTLDSPRAAHKRLRTGYLGSQNGTSGTQTLLVQESGSISQWKRFAPDASIVLVGIRGSGKRSLGFIAAAALRRRFVTEDFYFQTITGVSRQEYLRLHGSEEFYKQDVAVAVRMLEDNKHGCVIDCGLGSLTRALQEQLKVYCQTNPVIYVQRDISSVKKLLKLSDKSARMLEAGDTSHRRCSNFEFYNLEDDSQSNVESSDEDRGNPTYSFKLQQVQIDFSNFVHSISTLSPTTTVGSEAPFSTYFPIESKLFTHTLCLPVSLYRSGGYDFSRLESGGDAVEVRIDEWQDGTATAVSRLVAEARRCINVPVMVSMVHITDRFPVNLYFSGVCHALRLAPEFLIIDLTLERNWISELTARNSSTRFVGLIRYSRADSLLKDSDRVIALVEKALALKMSLIRVTAYSTSRKDGDRFDEFIRVLKHRYASRLWFSAYLTGPFGRTSQVFNPVLTAVTHESIRERYRADEDPTPDITSCEALRGLVSSFTLDPLHFFVFGANVSDSLSPVMHNSAYAAVGLPHDYTAVNVHSWEHIRRRAQASDFGGASIAQPWKVKIVEHLSHLSDHARAMGAINTLVPIRGESTQQNVSDQATYRNRAGPVVSFYGDNSDWISIQTTLKRNLSPRNVIHSKTSALIVGAGGMARAACYALLHAGCRNIFIYNRTISNARTLAQHFLNWGATQNYSVPAQIRVFGSLNEPWPDGFSQPTIIISCVTHERLPGEEHVADFTVPEQWLRSETGGAAVEQAYYLRTPLIEQIKHLHATTGKPWVVVDGLEVLHAQATAQFEIMTGRKAPKSVMWDALQSAVAARNGRL